MQKAALVRNPLTIIAVFATIAETSGTAILPFISSENQYVYILFLMFFPTYLVALFFLTLNFNHHVLYAPSDFRDEDNYFKRFEKSAPAERAEKLDEEVREAEMAAINVESPDEPPSLLPPPSAVPDDKTPDADTTPSNGQTHDLRTRYIKAEEFALDILKKRFGASLRKNVKLEMEPGRRLLFDGAIVNNNKVRLVEVKYFKDNSILVPRIVNVLMRLSQTINKIPENIKSDLSLLIIIVTDEPFSDKGRETLKKFQRERAFPFPVPFEIELMHLSEQGA